MLYLPIIGIVLVAIAGCCIESNAFAAPGKHRVGVAFGKKLLWNKKRNLNEVDKDAEVDMNKRIERFARKSSSVYGRFIDDFLERPPTAILEPKMLKRYVRRRKQLGRKHARGANADQSQSTKAKEVTTRFGLWENNFDNNPNVTQYVGVFERKMKEFRQQQHSTQEAITFEPLPPIETNTNIKIADTTASFQCGLSNSKDLSPEKYLKIRHALRNYLVRTNVWSPQYKSWGRRKRCYNFNCPKHKGKKSPPTVCLPYIKKGQDDMLRFLVSVMQSMLNKSCNLKRPYSLKKLKCNVRKLTENEDVEKGCDATSEPKSPSCQPSIAFLPFAMPYLPVTQETTCATTNTPPTTTQPTFPTTRPDSSPPSFSPSDVVTSASLPPRIFLSFDPIDSDNKSTTEQSQSQQSSPKAFSVCSTDTLPPWPTMPPCGHNRCKPCHQKGLRFRPEYSQRWDHSAREDSINLLRKPNRKFNRVDLQMINDAPEKEKNQEARISIFDRRFPNLASAVRDWPRRKSASRKITQEQFLKKKLEAERWKRDDEEKESTSTNAFARHKNDEDVHQSTTFKSAVFVKSPKKSFNHPKVFAKVFPESFLNPPEESAKDKTLPGISTIQLKLLAVCEGYLELVKLVRTNNQSDDNDLDGELIRYCESEISKSFDQSESEAQSQIPPTKGTQNNFNADFLGSSAYQAQQKNHNHRAIDVDSVRLLQKNKESLDSWLLGTDGETEYLDEEAPSVRRMGNETTTTTTTYPVNAKRIGISGRRGRNSTGNAEILTEANLAEEREIDDGRSVVAVAHGGNGRIQSNNTHANSKLNQTIDGDDEVNEMIEEEETTTATAATTATDKTKKFTTMKNHSNHTLNGTYAQAVSAAKELAKDYTIEFLNYAVYIIPILFILLFLLCCLCFILKIMSGNRQKRKKKKKRKRRETSSGTESDTTEESSVLYAKNREKSKLRKLWAEFMPQKKNYSDDEDESTEDKKSKRKKLWAALMPRKKLYSDDEDETTEDKKSIGKKLFMPRKKEDSEEENEDKKKNERKFQKFLQKLWKEKKDEEDSDPSEVKKKWIEKKFFRFLRKQSKIDDGSEDGEKKRWSDKRFIRFLLQQQRKMTGQKHYDSENADEEKKAKRLLKSMLKQDHDSEESSWNKQLRERRSLSLKKKPEVEEDYEMEEKTTPNDSDDMSEKVPEEDIAKERRELIALLEELKNLEQEQVELEKKKKYKSVYVQYVADDVLQNTEKGPFPDVRSFRGFGIFENIPEDAVMKIYQRSNQGRQEFLKVEETTRSDILDRFWRMSRDLGVELVSGSAEDITNKFDLLTRMLDQLPSGNVSPRKKSILMEELDNLRRQLQPRKYIRMKDDGVLCRF